jgi:hypothetical protein
LAASTFVPVVPKKPTPLPTVILKWWRQGPRIVAKRDVLLNKKNLFSGWWKAKPDVILKHK